MSLYVVIRVDRRTMSDLIEQDPFNRRVHLLLPVVHQRSGQSRMSLNAQLLPFVVTAESFGKRPLTRRPAPSDPTTPSGIQPTRLQPHNLVRRLLPCPA